MKIINSILACMILTFFISCGGDEDEVDMCTTDAWAGTYSGSINCDDGTTITVSVIVTKVDESTIQLTYDGETSQIPVNGCNFDFSGVLNTFLGDIDIEYKGELSGTQLNFEVGIGIAGQSANCDGTLNK